MSATTLPSGNATGTLVSPSVDPTGIPDLRMLVSPAALTDFRRGCVAALASISTLSRSEIEPFHDRYSALLARFRQMDADRFSALFEWPSMIAWSRELFPAVQRYVAGGEPAAARQCEDLIRFGECFAIASALDGEGDVTFNPPLPLALPFHLPGTAWVVDGDGFGEGEIVVARASAAGLHLQDGRVLTPGDGLAEADRLMLGNGRNLMLSPAALITPWASMPFAIPALGLQWNYQHQHLGLMAETLDIIARHAAVDFRIMGETMRVAALKPLVPGRALNASYNEFPGACVLAVVHNPFEMASYLIHEMYHTLLGAVEARGALLPANQLVEESEIRCYSPWRMDMRPPRGLLHALVVSEPVSDFWFDVLESDPGDPILAAYARDQVVRGVVQRSTGLASFLRVATPTDRGRQLCEALAVGVGRDVQRACDLKLHADIPSLEVWPDGAIRPESLLRDAPELTVHESLFNHASKYDAGDWAVRWMAARPWMFRGFRRP